MSDISWKQGTSSSAMTTVVGAAIVARSSMLFGRGACGSALVQFTPE